MLPRKARIANQAAAIHVGFILIYHAVITRRIARDAPVDLATVARRLGFGLGTGVDDNGAATCRKGKGTRY